MRAFTIILATLAIGLSADMALAGPDDVSTGPVIEDFGPAAPLADYMAPPRAETYRVAFDTATAADDGALNSTFVGAARFLNMHAKAGVAPDRMALAIVVHGGAVADLMQADDDGNPNAPLLDALQDNGVRIVLCGQTAAHRGVTPERLLPGVEIALSAMTAHAELQQAGYTLNPF